MDKVVYMAWEEKDRQVKQQRVKMDHKVKKEREDTNRKIRLQRKRVDIKVRAALYQSLKQAHRDIAQYLMQERENMDKMLKAERYDTDCMIVRERVLMDAEKMQSRVEMDTKLQEYRDNVNSKHVVMKFIVHVGGTMKQNGYVGGRMASMTFAKIEWGLMVKKLSHHGLKGIADLYYLDPAKELPDGLVLMVGSDDVEQLLQDHEGRHICELYIVKYGVISRDNDDASDSDDGSGNDDGSDEKEDDIDILDIEKPKALLATKKGHMHKDIFKSRRSTVDNDVSSEKGACMKLAYGNKFKRNRDSWGCRNMGFNKAESSQPKKQQAIEHHGNPVRGGGSDSN